MKQDRLNSFSVGLGLLDYVNPIFYTITSLTILGNLYGKLDVVKFVLYTLGSLISIVFGLMIPTVKTLVGLGKMKFKMPVNLVFFVNSGIFISGLVLFTYVLHLNNLISIIIFMVTVLVLIGLLYKIKKVNTIAVLTGMVGYMMIYVSLIIMAIREAKTLSIIMYALAIVIFIYLGLVGIKSDLKKPKVHWAIEISNVVCQGLVAFSTLNLFRGL